MCKFSSGLGGGLTGENLGGVVDGGGGSLEVAARYVTVRDLEDDRALLVAVACDKIINILVYIVPSAITS